MAFFAVSVLALAHRPNRCEVVTRSPRLQCFRRSGRHRHADGSAIFRPRGRLFGVTGPVRASSHVNEEMIMPFYKSRYFVPALSLLLFAVTFRFGTEGFSWFWSEQPVVAGMLLATSAVFWVLLFVSRRKSSRTF